MKYFLAIYSDEAAEAKKPKDVLEAEMGQYFAFTNGVKDAGVYVAGEALYPVTSATTVRVLGGKITPTDGPFAETKEQLGGFYIIDCKNLDEAIEWAAKIPHASQGCVEIRPVVDFSQGAPA